MRYCPAGDGEFTDAFDVCPICGREFEAEPPTSPTGPEGDEVVWLTTAPNEPEAHLWADVVRSRGIQVFIRAGGPGVGAWASASSFEHDLLVHRRNLLKAHATVRDLLTQPHVGLPRARRGRPVVNPRQKPV